MRFKPYEVTNMLWAYAKLKEWNAQLFRCGFHPAVVGSGWLVVGWMDGKIRECVWMGRYAMIDVDAELYKFGVF